MKEVFENKTKFYLFTTLLFIFTAVLVNIFESVSPFFMYIVFPIEFFLLSFMWYHKNELSYKKPIAIMMIYMLVGCIFMYEYMSGLSIVESLTLGLIAILAIKITRKARKIELNKEDKTIIKNEKLKKIVNFSMPLICIVILEIYYKICTFGTPKLTLTFCSLVLTLIIAYTIYLLILSVIRNTFVTTLTFFLVFLFLFVANQMRIFYTSDTLLLTDVSFLETTGELTNFIDVTLINAINYVIFPTIIVGAIFIYLLHICYNNNLAFKTKKKNICVFIVSLCMLIVLFIPISRLDKFILNNVYNYKSIKDYTMTVSNTKYYSKYGVIGGMYGKLLETRRYEPIGYEEEEVDELLSNVKESPNKGKIGKPNVIVVFSESFWDVSKIDGIKFSQDVTPNYHALKEKGKVVEMITPSYGGISSNVEFEILTGGSLNYFSKGYIPYMQLYNKKLSSNTPSIIKEFKNNGYKTVILNASSKEMFKCDNVYDFYGVDERHHLYDELKQKSYVTDDYLMNQVIEYFNNKDEGEKTFYFAITMGGHMPYYEERYKDYEFEVTETDYNDDITGTIKSYAKGMYLADASLKKLYDYINTIDEETIIVFFGDHLPHLQTKTGQDALFLTNFLNKKYDLESTYRQFNTEALILSNYDMDFDDTKYLSDDLLFTYIMSYMDMNLSPYYNFLYSTIDTLPSSNYVVSMDKNGQKYYTMALEGEMKDTYNLREKVQYRLFR